MSRFYSPKEASISDLRGKTLVKIEQLNDELQFITFFGDVYRMHHEQDCCESVVLEEIVGDLDDLIAHPLLVAEEVSNAELPPQGDPEYEPESYTWTFYKLSTIKGSVTLRWYGSSNGYYSERVNFELVKSAED
jgi:hypothetical protein